MSYTSLQIKDIEDCIKEAQRFRKSDYLKDTEYYRMAKTLCSRVESMGVKVTLPFSWTQVGYEEIMPSNDGVSKPCNNDMIDKNMYALEIALQDKLNALSYYNEYKNIRDDIINGKKTKEKNQSNFIIQMSIKYNGKIDFGKAVQEYVKKSDDFCIFDNTKAIFNGVLQKMQLYLDDVCNEKTTKKATKSEPKTVVNVNQNNNQTVNQNTEVTIEHCFKSLDDCESISEEEIKKLKEQISEIEELLKDKLGKKKTVKEKIGNILKWLGDKTTEVMIATLPTIMQLLSKV